ncbi:MAG TPA: HAD family phosphatase [Mycobacteriales bacterium]|nr:HAD family phosphatase [Mycobacteriales bacterium]
MTVQAVVFDLGGVLAEFSGVATMRELARISSDEELWARWLGCDWVRRFERGQCSPEDFAEGMVGEWRLPMTAPEFLAAFGEWVQAPYDGAEDLVTETAQRVPVAMLSNMNAVHWDRAVSAWSLVKRFDHVFTSFELGLIKPDAEVFHHVVDALGVEPEQVFFLDDNRINVEGARAAGLQAEQVRGVAEARAAVSRKIGDGFHRNLRTPYARAP